MSQTVFQAGAISCADIRSPVYTCLDYKEGHLCKHCHKLRAMEGHSNAFDKCDSSPLNDYTFTPIPYASERAVCV